MSFVHVKALNVLLSERREHPYTSYAQDHFLAQALVRVSAIQEIR